MSNDITLSRPTAFDHKNVTRLIQTSLDRFRSGWIVEYSPANAERDYAMWFAQFGNGERPTFSFWSSEYTHKTSFPWPAITAHGGGHSDLEHLILDHVLVAIIREWDSKGVEWRLWDDGCGEYTPNLDPPKTLYDYWHQHYSHPWPGNEQWPSSQGEAAIEYYSNVRCWMERGLMKDKSWNPWIGGDPTFKFDPNLKRE